MASVGKPGGQMTEKNTKPPFYLIDTSADFYRPLGVRLAICISVACWAALEIWNRDGFWGVLSGAAFIYCTYVLLITYNPPPKVEPAARPDDPEEDEDADKDELGKDEAKDDAGKI
jgi:hypothetical protein